MQNLIDMLSKIGEINVSNLNNTELLNFLISFSSLFVAMLSFLVSVVVLFYSGYQFFLKKGSSFYGTFSISSSAWSKQGYIGEIILENMKDKASPISYVYLRIGNNIYLELLDYSESPRIIGPFETIKIGLREGVSGYISSTFKVDIDALLSDRKVKKTLMVATPKGISKVKNYKTFWNVYIASLQNNFIIPVRPVRKYYDGKEYSDSLQFVVTNQTDEAKTEEHFLYRNKTYSINNVSVKTDDFSNADDLENFLKQSAEPPFRRLKVELVEHTFNGFDKYPDVDIFHLGFFGTNVFGKAYTKISSLIFRIKNKLKKFR